MAVPDNGAKNLIGELASVLIFQCSNKGNSPNIDLKEYLTIQNSGSKVVKQKSWGFWIVGLKNRK